MNSSDEVSFIWILLGSLAGMALMDTIVRRLWWSWRTGHRPIGSVDTSRHPDLQAIERAELQLALSKAPPKDDGTPVDLSNVDPEILAIVDKAMGGHYDPAMRARIVLQCLKDQAKYEAEGRGRR